MNNQDGSEEDGVRDLYIPSFASQGDGHVDPPGVPGKQGALPEPGLNGLRERPGGQGADAREAAPGPLLQQTSCVASRAVETVP